MLWAFYKFIFCLLRSGASICTQSLHHQCCSTRDGPLRSRLGGSSYTRWGPDSEMAIWLRNSLSHSKGTHSRPGSCYMFCSRSGSDASPVLRRDPLGGLPCQPFPAAGCCSQQLCQSAGGKPEPAEPTAGQMAGAKMLSCLFSLSSVVLSLFIL